MIELYNDSYFFTNDSSLHSIKMIGKKMTPELEKIVQFTMQKKEIRSVFFVVVLIMHIGVLR